MAAAFAGLLWLRLAIVLIGWNRFLLTAAWRLVFGNLAGKLQHAAPARRQGQQNGIGEDQNMYRPFAHA